MQTWPFFDGIAHRHITRQDNDSNAAPGDCSLHGDLEDAGHLLGLRNQLTIMAALTKSCPDESPENIRSRFHCLEFALRWPGREHDCGGSRRAR